MKLLITRKIPAAGIKILNEFPEIELDYRQSAPLSEKDLIEAIKDKDAIIPVIPDDINKNVIEAGNNLKLIAHYAVGYDNIDVETATKKGVYVSNTPGDLTESVAEFTMGLILATSKSIVEADKYTRGGKYTYWDPMIFLGPSLRGKTLGIIGMGRIGSYLAKIAHGGFGMKIVYSNPQEVPQVNKDHEAKLLRLENLLESSDFVAITCPLVEATYHLIGEKELHHMKPTAYLINTARGPIVNEAALFRALKENWIEGAGLDVFENEPKMYAGLSELSNVVLTPHIASATREARIQMATMAAHNVIDVLIHKKPPTNLVNKELTNSLV